MRYSPCKVENQKPKGDFTMKKYVAEFQSIHGVCYHEMIVKGKSMKTAIKRIIATLDKEVNYTDGETLYVKEYDPFVGAYTGERWFFTARQVSENLVKWIDSRALYITGKAGRA